MDNRSPLPPLTLSQEDMQQLATQVMGIILEHFSTLECKPVTTPSVTAEIRHKLNGGIPMHPTPVAEILDQLRTDVFEQMTHLDHPCNFAFVPGPGNFVSAMADAIASALNVFCGAWLGPSAVAQIELITIEWLRQLFHFPEEASGLFVSGGSMANITGLAVARQVMLANNTTNATVYFSDQTHSSVAKGLRILGFQQFQIRKISSDEDFRLPLDVLRQKMAADRLQGMVPFCVVANAGTTNTGAVDPLEELHRFCKEEGLWLHIDGAYGGSAAITEKGRGFLRGIELADSLSIDPHKWMFQPYEIGCVLVRNREHLKETFKVTAEYLKVLERDREQINFSDYGIQLTRGFRALKLWMSLKAFGIDAFRDAITRGIENACTVEAMLSEQPCWEIVTPAQLGVITFRYIMDGLDETELETLNGYIIEQVIQSGRALLSPTILRGMYVLRMCTINPRTSADDLAQTIALLRRFGDDYIAARP